MIINKNDTKDFIAMLSEGETRITDVRNAKYVYVFRKEGDKVTFAHVKKGCIRFRNVPNRLQCCLEYSKKYQ